MRGDKEASPAGPLHEFLERIDDLKKTAEAAIVEEQLGARHLAHLQRRLKRLDKAFDKMEKSVEVAQEGEDQARQHLADALRTSRAKTQLLATLGHDLRQPLTVIVGALEALEPDTVPSRLKMLARAKAASRRLERALGSLMEASQLEYGKVQAELQAFAIGRVLSEVCDQHEPDAKAKGLKLVTVPCEHHVLSDPLLLASILHNLLENAIKYTRAGRILVGCRHKENVLSVEVIDTGIGIEEAMLSAIFDEYKQIAHSFAGGIGLGLYIVKRSADLLGHGLTVRSKFGKGSCFAVGVPLSHAAVA
jgi:signal transduction histidine kinase